MDNRNDIERNRQLRRIADALEKIVKNTQKSVINIDDIIPVTNTDDIVTVTYNKHGVIINE